MIPSQILLLNFNIVLNLEARGLDEHTFRVRSLTQEGLT